MTLLVPIAQYVLGDINKETLVPYNIPQINNYSKVPYHPWRIILPPKIK
jgi:hypothetical protein